MRFQGWPWATVLVLQILSGVNAGIMFSKYDRATAGYIAGSVFFLVGIMAFYVCLKHSLLWRALNVGVASIFLFGFTTPLLLARLMTEYPLPVESVFGLPLELFHRGSERSYAVLAGIVLLQLGFAVYTKTKTQV